jgi:hypothetical protein
MKKIGHRETQRKTQSSTEVFLLQPKEKPLHSFRGIFKSFAPKNWLMACWFLTALPAISQVPIQNDLQGFNEFLGFEKQAALDSAVSSFQEFLNLNYEGPDGIIHFLIRIRDSGSFDPNWVLPRAKSKKILEAWEISGLRKDIWLYGYEDYQLNYNPKDLLEDQVLSPVMDSIYIEIEDEIVPLTNHSTTDTLEPNRANQLSRNRRGQFNYALAKFASNDPFISGYVEAVDVAGDISSRLSANAFISDLKNYEEPFAVRVIVIEFYYGLMKYDLENNTE